MATREELLRDLILSPHGRLTIVRDTADRETRKALTSLIDADPQRATHAASELDLVVHPDDERLDAYTMHNTMAVARNLLLTVTEPTPEADIVTRFAPSGFTAAMVRDGVNFLRRDGLATRREGVITVLVAPPATAPNIPTELLLPRTLTAQPAPATRYESTPVDTDARRNSAIPSAADVGDLDAAPVRRNTSLGTGTASFEVGDLPEGSLNPVKKPVTEEASVAEPTAALIAYKSTILDAFARHKVVSAPWSELAAGTPRPAVGDLPEGWNGPRLLETAIQRMVDGDELLLADTATTTLTLVAARDAVKAVRAALDAWIANPANSDDYTAGLLRSVASQADVTLPMGWSAETLYDLAMTELLAARTLTQEGATYHRKPMPAPAPVAPPAPATVAPTKPESPAPTAPAPAPAASNESLEDRIIESLTAAGAADTAELAKRLGVTYADAMIALRPLTASGAVEKVPGKLDWRMPAATPPAPVKPAPAAPKAPAAPSSPPKAPAAPAPKAPAAPAINSPALEKKVDNLTNSVERVERKLDTLPPPPSAEKVLMDEADDAVKSLLESVCVRLKVDGALTEGAIHRALPGRSKPSRVNPNPVDKRLRLGEALALGVDARILDFDHVTRKYRLITVTNLMPKTDLERRVKRIKDMREAA